MMNGMLRAGGDTTFVLWADLVSQWGVAIPLTWITALVLGLPFPLVFLAVNAEEIVKFLVSGRRLLRRRWIRNLVADPAADTPHPLEVS
jgi:Na+-driven multidrug efflux pump